MSIFQDAAEYYLRFRICWCNCLQKVKVYQQTKFVDISQLTAEIELLPFWKKTNVRISNSTSGFDFGYSTAVGMLFCIMLPNFIQIGQPTAEIWRHIHFLKWRPLPLNTTSGFAFVDVLPSEGQCLSANQISSTYLNSLSRYNYFRFEKQTSAILEFYFRFRPRPFRVIGVLSCIRLPNFI